MHFSRDPVNIMGLGLNLPPRITLSYGNIFFRKIFFPSKCPGARPQSAPTHHPVVWKININYNRIRDRQPLQQLSQDVLSETILTIKWVKLFLLQNVFSYYRMCALTPADVLRYVEWNRSSGWWVIFIFLAFSQSASTRQCPVCVCVCARARARITSYTISILYTYIYIPRYTDIGMSSLTIECILLLHL